MAKHFRNEQLTIAASIEFMVCRSGRYVVWAGGGGQSYSIDPYDDDVPTYSPGSNRDTAAEITVRAGEETTNVDIRYRGESGRTVSGTVTNAPGGSSAVVVILSSVLEGGPQLNSGSTG